jgi:hypothetical protein
MISEIVMTGKGLMKGLSFMAGSMIIDYFAPG